jgi:hypothetical protein
VGRTQDRRRWLVLGGASAALVTLSLAVGGDPAVAAGATEGDGAGAPKSLPSPASVTARVDALMVKGWADGKVEPRPAADDAEFLRRLSLDTSGVIPDEDTVRAFLASKDPDKRAAAIREALSSDGYARSMALRWSYLLVGREFLYKSLGMKYAGRPQPGMAPGMAPGMTGADDSDAPYDGPVPPLTGWLETKLAANTRWDEVVRALITANGNASDDGATHYMLRFAKDGDAKAAELAGSTMKIFQGLQIQCAQCHDHPYTDWKQRDFWGIAAFFTRMSARREPNPKTGEKGKGPFVIYERPNGQARLPAPPGEQGALALPRFATGEVCNPGGGVDRRAEVARMITDEKNPYFARAMVNRVWSFFFGRGLIAPVDDPSRRRSRTPRSSPSSPTTSRRAATTCAACARRSSRPAPTASRRPARRRAARRSCACSPARPCAPSRPSSSSTRSSGRPASRTSAPATCGPASGSSA